MTTLFSPMHFPVLLCGVLCGPYLGLICGTITPIMSFFAVGRPPFPNGLVPMIFELAAYGFVTGFMRWLFLKNSKTHKVASVLALVVAMIVGRVLNAFVGAFFIGEQQTYFAALGAKLLGNFTSTWAGILLQIVLIPTVLFALKRGGILIKYLPDEEGTAKLSKKKEDAAIESSESDPKC